MPIVLTNKEMRPRDKFDHYPTPEGLIVQLFKQLKEAKLNPKAILDPGAGDGVWGKVARFFYPESYIRAMEIRSVDELETPNADLLSWYDAYYDGVDYLEPHEVLDAFKYDLIIGNPPYRYAEEFVRRSHELLINDGVIIFLLKLDFLASQKRGRGLWKEFPPAVVSVCSRRPSFTGDRKTYADNYALYIWGHSKVNVKPNLGWFDWNYLEKGEDKNERNS